MPRFLTIAAVAACLALAAAPAAGAQSRCGDHPWCDTSLSPDQRAELLLAQLTLPEKQDLLWGDEQFGVANPPGGQSHTGKNYGNPRLAIPDVNFSDGPVGTRQGATSTSMPAPLGLAASFDPALAAAAGRLVADEVKAKGNDVVFAPTANIMRTPRGGRSFEGYGEDTFLAARTAVDWIRAAQSRGVIADVKHFAANNQETDRMSIDERIDERTLREIYLPQFEAAVKEGGSGTVMCAYNQVNSQFACENRHLLTDVLYGDWGFKGFVIADYPAAHDTAASLKNGLTFEPFGQAYSPAQTTRALLAGQIKEADIDVAIRRLLRTMFAFGVFDRAAYANDESQIPLDEHAAIARRIEEGGITLLKNRRLAKRKRTRALPLKARKLKTIALIGSDADKYKNGGGSSNVTPARLITPKQGIEQRAGSGIQIRYDGSDDPASSAQTAKGADVAIVVAADTASEGVDAPCMALDCTDHLALAPGFGTMPGKERNLDAVIDAVTKANRRTVVVLETSAPVLTPWRTRAAAIVEAWYPGESGGAAIARTLFGDVDPGGRLPGTFPLREEDLPTHGDPRRFPGTDGVVEYQEGVLVGYRWYDQKRLKVAYPFGHGLSYTRFKYSKLRIRGDRVSARVRNVGRRTGKTVAQLYVGMPQPAAGVVQPPRQLKGFRKLRLKPGQAKRVVFRTDARSFSYWDVASGGWKIAPGCYRLSVGRSSRDLPLRGSRALAGGSCPKRR